jgi:hypothetical protein
VTRIEAAGSSSVDADETLVDYVLLETLTTQQQDRHFGYWIRLEMMAAPHPGTRDGVMPKEHLPR